MLLLLYTATPLVIDDLEYNDIPLSVTCTSSGAPVDSVTWLKDGSEVRGDSSIFSHTQIVINALSAIYQNTLYIRDPSHLVGSFTCRVEDVSGNTDEKTLIINGIKKIILLSRDLYSPAHQES